jgi:hypothetical protein
MNRIPAARRTRRRIETGDGRRETGDGRRETGLPKIAMGVRHVKQTVNGSEE